MRIHFKLTILSLCLYQLSACNSHRMSPYDEYNSATNAPNETYVANHSVNGTERPMNPYARGDYNPTYTTRANAYENAANPELYSTAPVSPYPKTHDSYISEVAPPRIPAVKTPPYQYNAMGAERTTKSYDAVGTKPAYQSFRKADGYYAGSINVQQREVVNRQVHSSNPMVASPVVHEVPIIAPQVVQPVIQTIPQENPLTTQESNVPVYNPAPVTGGNNNFSPNAYRIDGQNQYNMYDYNQQNMMLETMGAVAIGGMMSTPTAIPPHLDPKNSQKDLQNAINATSMENVARDSGRHNITMASNSASTAAAPSTTAIISHSSRAKAPVSLLLNSQAIKTKPVEIKQIGKVTNDNVSNTNTKDSENISKATSVIDDIKTSTTVASVTSTKTPETQPSDNATHEITKEISKRKMWIARPGDDLRALLTSWAKESGWHVVWQTDRQYTLAAGTKMKGKFVNVASAIIRAFARATPAPRVVFYRGNRVMVITTMEDDNAE